MNYSQNQEQEAILNHFGDFKGSFIDIGANDGVTLSNTRALAELGWCGVLVEPSPQAFAKLKNLYSAEKKGCFYLYDFAIGTHNGSIKFFESGTHLNKGDVGLLSTSEQSEMTRFPGMQYNEIEVKVFRWKTAMNRMSLRQFDFVNIDAEGLCLDIAMQMDFKEARCVCIEWNGDNNLKEAYSKIFEGFKIIYTSAENLIYAR